MDILVQVSVICYLITAFSGAMLGFLFLTHKIKNNWSNIFLVIFIWSLAYSLINEFLTDSDVIKMIGERSFIFNTIMFIVPSLFLYIVSHSKKNEIKYWLLLYIPGLLINLLPDSEFKEIVLALLYLLTSVPLFILSMHYLKKYRKGFLNKCPVFGHKTLSWIRVLMITVIGLHIFMFTTELLIDESLSLDIATDFIESLVTFFIVYWLGVKGFEQDELQKEKLVAVKVIPTQEKIITEEPNKEKNLLIEDSKKFECLCKIIEKEKIYTDPNLTIKSLSKELKVRERELSNLINNCTKKNFYQFINQFRVVEFKKLIASEKATQYSILGLAKEAGFSSKSTFYKSFKELEGITPSEYKKKQKVS
ncbi:AraC family transcriptional regulator [Tenacibaculum sp. 190524A02b]|uniref:helix-turn-helix domain-containing protein n=1 Tax=Tenacibaculum vairaonense TaxID=3137860 RepID=UPI0032B2D710